MGTEGFYFQFATVTLKRAVNSFFVVTHLSTHFNDLKERSKEQKIIAALGEQIPLNLNLNGLNYCWIKLLLEFS